MYLQRLKDLREDADLKQYAVAQYLGIQQNVYSRYERGTQTIPLQHLIKLADFYDVSLDFLCGRTNNTKINR
jgi:transcriptional regulator with XRE-family HTH domain